MIDIAVPLLAGAFLLVVLFEFRRRAAERHRTQMQHICSSRDLLEAHRISLKEFLAAKEAPDSLKRLLMGFSNIISDRDSMISIADFLGSRRGGAVDDDEELMAQIDELKSIGPELTQVFAFAVITGTMAGILRWPETSSQYEVLSARLLSDHRREVAMAVTVSRFRKLDFGFAPDFGHAGVAA